MTTKLIILTGNILRPVALFLMWLHVLWAPFVIALVTAALPASVLMEWGPANLVRGAYEAGPWGFGCIVLVLGFLHGSLVVNSRLMWTNALDRSGLSAKAGRDISTFQKRVMYVLYALGPVLTILTCLQLRAQMPDKILWRAGTEPQEPAGWWLYILTGVLGALLSLGSQAWLRKLTRRDLGRTFMNRLDRIFAHLGEGYTAKDGPDTGHVAPGHLVSFLLAVVTAVVFAGFAFLPRHLPPAAFYVLMLLLALSWILTGLSFFLLKYRVPVYLLIIGWLLLGPNLWGGIEYTFDTQPAANEKLPPPGVVIGFPEENRLKGSPVAVAAVGGGIHSGAWEVEVLTRLQELTDGGVMVCGNLADNIRALSGVSGGAYGAMLYAHAMYPYHKVRTAGDLENLRAVTQSSSLSAVVGALTYHDLVGYCLPVFWGQDRGAAMEEAWENNANRAGMGPDLRLATFDSWAGSVGRSEMPAVLFTSATVESGRPVIFGSSAVADWNFNVSQGDIPGTAGASFPPLTLKVSTGARLSATFPWVSPAARPDPKNPTRRAEHQLDGGYYDNFGIVALNSWLEGGLNDVFRPEKSPPLPPSDRPGESTPVAPAVASPEALRNAAYPAVPPPPHSALLVIQIRYQGGQREEPETAPEGFFHQVMAPLLGLFSARVSGQRLRADERFDQFCRYWGLRGVAIHNAAFAYPENLPEIEPDEPPPGPGPAIQSAEQQAQEQQTVKQERKEEKRKGKPETNSRGAPLSWHLTHAEKADITRRGLAIQKQFDAYKKGLLALEGLAPEEYHKSRAQLDQKFPLGAAANQVAGFLKSAPAP